MLFEQAFVRQFASWICDILLHCIIRINFDALLFTFVFAVYSRRIDNSIASTCTLPHFVFVEENDIPDIVVDFMSLRNIFYIIYLFG
jgi:hypothetical protein